MFATIAVFLWKASRLFSVAGVMIVIGSTTWAQSGQAIYDDTCLLCHGDVQKQSSWHRFLQGDGSEVKLAVVTPRGPTLNGIVGRPVATIPNFSYSKGMRKFATTGAVWDRETLDKFLTNSRKFVKGTFMVQKMEKEDRKKVLDFLESIAPYQR